MDFQYPRYRSTNVGSNPERMFDPRRTPTTWLRVIEFAFPWKRWLYCTVQCHFTVDFSIPPTAERMGTATKTIESNELYPIIKSPRPTAIPTQISTQPLIDQIKDVTGNFAPSSNIFTTSDSSYEFESTPSPVTHRFLSFQNPDRLCRLQPSCVKLLVL